jgi:hypothetical protein
VTSAVVAAATVSLENLEACGQRDGAFHEELAMPEYLAPGVYVEEYDSAPRSIPGVSAAIDDATARQLVESVKRIVGLDERDWIGLDQSDPGIALIRLCAWLADSLVYRAGSVADQRRDAALRALAPLLSSGCSSPCAPLKRPRFFAGQLLDAATLAAEQDYQRERLRRHNRALHGVGIVSGLGVHVDASGDAPRVTIEPGCAIDPCGDQMVICERATVRLPADAHEAFVSLRRWERACDPVPGPNGPEPTRIEEVAIIAISAHVAPNSIALARVVCEPGGWAADANFARPLAESTPHREG